MIPHDYLDDEARDRAALYAMRALPDREAAGFETHLSACAICRAEVEELERACSEMALLGPPASPPAGLRAKVRGMARGASRERAGAERKSPPAPIAVVAGDQGAWLQTPFEGVEMRVLHLDESSGRMTQLMRMAPGASFPRHRHTGLEECYVIQGDMRSGDVILRAGDYQRAEQGSIHGISSRGGCVMLVVGNAFDELLEEVKA